MKVKDFTEEHYWQLIGYIIGSIIPTDQIFPTDKAKEIGEEAWKIFGINEREFN